MIRPPAQAGKFADLPVLTEVVEAGADHFDRPVLSSAEWLRAGIPVLTEIIANEVPALVAHAAAPLSDAECAQLAARIAWFDDPATPYRSRVKPFSRDSEGDYDHLARVREWSAAGREEEL